MNKNAAIVAFALLASAYDNASALTVTLDSFTVTKNNNASFFVDNFNDGLPPPESPVVFPSGPATYSVKGALSESGGKLTLDDTAALSMNALGQQRQIVRGTLNTNMSNDPANLGQGLKITDTFSVTGVFDLDTSLVAGDAYGVRFVDRNADGSTTGDNNFVELAVQQTAAGTFVRFYEEDFAAHTITTLGQVNLFSVLPGGADQVGLTLARNDLGNNDVVASFDFLSDGSQVGNESYIFLPVGSLFDGEDFTRAEFYASSDVPEPSSVLLLTLGILGLSWAVRRRIA